MLDPELASHAIRLALERGATDAECTIAAGEEFSAQVRMRDLETLKDAGSRRAGLRVLIGKRVGSSHTSDLSTDGVRQMVESALAIAAISTEDPFADLPDASELGSLTGDLQLYSDDIVRVETPARIQAALETEEAALSWDARITNSDGASFSAYAGERVFANSRGFLGSYRTSSCSISTSPVARQGDSMERDFWYSSARSHSKLDSPLAVGRRAAERTVRRLGARKVPTQKVPVIFDSVTARSLLGNIFEAVEGESIYRKASFVAG
jgi:PmbA protein